jgi:hypothetical protein
MIIHKELIQGTEAWHMARLGKLSASRVTPLMAKKGLGAGARTLAIELLAETLTGEPLTMYTSDAMQRGTELEADAREIYAANYAAVEEVGGIEDNGLFYSPDGLVANDGLIEIKSPLAKQHLINLITPDFELGYINQIQFGLMVSGRKWLDLISFNPDYHDSMAMRVKRIYRDDEFISLLRERIAEFETIVVELKGKL